MASLHSGCPCRAPPRQDCGQQPSVAHSLGCVFCHCWSWSPRQPHSPGRPSAPVRCPRCSERCASASRFRCGRSCRGTCNTSTRFGVRAHDQELLTSRVPEVSSGRSVHNSLHQHTQSARTQSSMLVELLSAQCGPWVHRRLADAQESGAKEGRSCASGRNGGRRGDGSACG